MSSKEESITRIDSRHSATQRLAGNGNGTPGDSHSIMRAVIRDYFAVLETELRGGRGPASLGRWAADRGGNDQTREIFHRQISGTLIGYGLPYLTDRPPRADAPVHLRRAVGEYLRNHPELFVWMESAVFCWEPEPDCTGLDLLDRLLPQAPSTFGAAPTSDDEATPLFGANFLAGEQRNRSLARAGEVFVIELESQRLRAASLAKYADTIEHTAAEYGDVPGYDIQSWNNDGDTLLIRVKTTRYGAETPFYVSENELALSYSYGERYQIYRIFDYRSQAKVYRVAGPLDRICQLTASTYRATLP